MIIESQSYSTPPLPNKHIYIEKQSFIDRLDRYFWRSDSVFATIADSLCPYKGISYLNSRCKRLMDLSIAIPAVVITIPAITILGVAKKLEDGGSMFFIQERVSNITGDVIRIRKVRCMHPYSDAGYDNIDIARGKAPYQDPRNTRLGSFMRRYQLEELPQLIQVLSGKLSLMGIRPAPEYVFEYLSDRWNEEKFRKWNAAYHSGRPGISGVNQVFGSGFKEDQDRFHYDVYYSQHASLGLDLYLLWKTLVRLLK